MRISTSHRNVVCSWYDKPEQQLLMHSLKLQLSTQDWQDSKSQVQNSC